MNVGAFSLCTDLTDNLLEFVYKNCVSRFIFVGVESEGLTQLR